MLARMRVVLQNSEIKVTSLLLTCIVDDRLSTCLPSEQLLLITSTAHT